jgi:hypothetical protein
MVVAAPLIGAPAVLAADASTPARRGAAYLVTRQADDGSVPSGWRADQVAESVIALAAAGDEQSAVGKALGFLARTAPAGASSGPYAGRIVSGLVAAGANPRSFAGTDFVARLESYYSPVSGGYGGSNVYADAIAMLGVLAAHRPLPDGAVTKLRLDQCSNGGWSQRSGCLAAADTDTTALAASVLAAVSGPEAPEVRAARQWLLASQRPTGCWGLQVGDPVNANSCGLAISAIVAFGDQPGTAPWSAGGREPINDLRALQLNSGAFTYQAGGRADDYATVQTVPALAGWSYPVAPATVSAAPAGARPSNQEQNTGNAQASRSGIAAKGAAVEGASHADGAVASPAAPQPSVLGERTQRAAVKARSAAAPAAHHRSGFSAPLTFVVTAIGLATVVFGGVRRVRGRRLT